MPISSSQQKNAGLSLLRMLDPDVLAHPHELYRVMRTHDPVHWDPYMHSWVVTGYSEVAWVLANCSSERSPGDDYLDELGLPFYKPFAQTMARQMLFMDGPPHTRLRGTCSTAFTTIKIEQLRSFIETHANRLLDKVGHQGHMDVVGDFAAPLPAIITAKLMGVPIEDHQLLGTWVSDIAKIHGNFQSHPDSLSEALQSLAEFRKYISAKMVELRVTPNDGLICSLMRAQLDGASLTEDEVIDNIIVMVIGGHETSTNLIASGFLALLQNPEAFEQLRREPGIVTSAVEELLRYEAPVQHTARIAPSDIGLGGKVLCKGSRIVAVLAAANRDPRRFANPDQLDLLRSDNRHLSFGWGAHFCFGASLARTEGQIALNTLLRRLVRPALRNQNVEWRHNAGLRGLTKLLVSFDS